MSSERGWLKQFGLLLALISLALVVWWLSAGYPRISPEGYRVAMALISACNQKDGARVQRIITQIESSSDDALPKADAKLLLKVAQNAMAGHWDWANIEIRSVMDAQVRH